MEEDGARDEAEPADERGCSKGREPDADHAGEHGRVQGREVVEITHGVGQAQKRGRVVDQDVGARQIGVRI